MVLCSDLFSFISTKEDDILRLSPKIDADNYYVEKSVSAQLSAMPCVAAFAARHRVDRAAGRKMRQGGVGQGEWGEWGTPARSSPPFSLVGTSVTPEPP